MIEWAERIAKLSPNCSGSRFPVPGSRFPVYGLRYELSAISGWKAGFPLRYKVTPSKPKPAKSMA